MKNSSFRKFRSMVPVAAGLMGFGLSLSADFSGYFNLGAPTLYNTVGDSTVGHWTYSIAESGTGQAVIDTTGGPGSLILAAVAPPGAGPLSGARPAGNVFVGDALSEARILAPYAGTFSFDVDTSVSTSFPGMTGGLEAFDSTTTIDLTTASHFELTLDAGEEFGFRATAQNATVAPSSGGGAGLMGLPGLANGFGGNEFIISNAVLTPVPEASTTAAIAGVAGALGFAAWRRRQGQQAS